MWTCKDCGTIVDQVWNNRGHTHSRCRECLNIRHRKLRLAREENNPELKQKRLQAVRKHELSNYGVTPEEYELKLMLQLGGCAICKQPSNKTLFVDHNHETGIVRDLLCHRCNTLLGYVENNEDLVIEAIEYLKRHDKRITV